MPLTLIRGRKLDAPDQIMVKDQLQALQAMLKVYGRAYLAQNLLWILQKKPEPDVIRTTVKLPSEHWNRRLVPFRFNRIQRDIDRRLGQKNICNKPRQAGYTTWFINNRLYIPAFLEPGTGGLLISQNKSYATMHFGILKRAHRYVGCIDPWDESVNVLHRQLLQNLLHTSASNRKEIIFDQIDSRVLIESAEVEEAAQGMTLHHLVCTEVARWPGNPEETLSNVKGALVDDGTHDIESTPNGLGGYYYEEWRRAELGGPNAEFVPHFHPWYWHDEYRVVPAEVTEDELTDEERRKKELFQLDLEQITWRRKTQVAFRHNFKEKFPEDSITCFLTTGRLFFDQEILAARLAELQVYKPLDIERNGDVVIYQLPIPGRQYIYGMDPAEGKHVNNEESDWSWGTMIDQETGDEVLSYHCRLAPEDFAADGVEICQHYNNAVFACERNNHGGTVILAANELGYGNIYKHREWHRRPGAPRRAQHTNKQQNQQRVVEYEGWPTTGKTRKLVLNKLGWTIRNYPEKIMSLELVKQCLTFVYNEKGVPAAMEGCHDDAVMSAAISHAVRNVLLGYLDPLTWQSKPYGAFNDEEEDLAV